MSEIVKRSLVLNGHSTSISLEEPFWEHIKELAGRRGMSVAGLVAEIDRERQSRNLSSAIRVFALADAKSARVQP